MSRPKTSGTGGLDVPGLPPVAPPRPVQVPAMPQMRLANGLTLVVAPRRNVPLVSVLLMTRQGPEADPVGHSGLASMTANVMTKGARRGGVPRDATAIARAAEALGTTLDASSSWRASTLGMSVTTPKLDAALSLLADVAAAPLLSTDELDRARQQVLDGLRVSLADPGALSAMVARRAFWGGSVYGAMATPATLQRLHRADLVACHRQAWQPSQTVLILAGDIDPDDARRLAERHFGGWSAAAVAAVASGVSSGASATTAAASAASAPLTAPAPVAPPWVLLDLPGSGQGGVVVTAPHAALGAADRRAALVAAAVLGGGYSARLNQEVRIKRGLSYGATGGGESQPGAGVFSAQAQTKPESALEVAQLMRQELVRLATEPPSADELAARQATLVGGFARRLETTGGLALLAASQLAAGRSLDELGRTVDEILAVTPQQVADYAARTWRPESLRATLVVDVQAAGNSLQALEAGALRLKKGELDLERPGLKKG